MANPHSDRGKMTSTGGIKEKTRNANVIPNEESGPAVVQLIRRLIGHGHGHGSEISLKPDS
ncbi:uncharacterized protein N7458_001150 [Penicillium daleae]|uniref:Uncharacterized protein n=1 Tax=Penicillium daleae TaxID=63821 RepID=A0AAD6CAL0_9EURO|nr:uncharacterized protein N7458_001150 [Penicillium daleae]KAJ5459598.1 hypothetical protein N7458_001150 [Penicillium daleae]